MPIHTFIHINSLFLSLSLSVFHVLIFFRFLLKLPIVWLTNQIILTNNLNNLNNTGHHFEKTNQFMSNPLTSLEKENIISLHTNTDQEYVFHFLSQQ